MNADSLMWRIIDGNKLVPLKPSPMRLEKHVEGLVESDPSCLGQPLLIIGRQKSITETGGPDLLAIDLTGRIHVIECKLAKTPRDTIAQVIEYWTWIETFDTDQVLAVFARFRPDVDLAEAFFEHFGCHMPAVLNPSQVITIVAATVDPKIEGSVQLLQRRGFPVTVVGYRYYQDLNAIQFVPYRHGDQDTEVSPATTRSRAQEPGRPASAGELARLHASIERLETRLEEFRPSLEALRRPSFAATTYGPVSDMRGIDQYILHFWQTYAWRFAWGFVPFSFLYELYQHWIRTQAAAGLHLPLLEDQIFGRRLAAAATATGEWSYTRRRADHLMDAPEPLTELVPNWKRPGKHQSVNGYLRSGIVGRRGEAHPT
ncbi:hypothetical protein [Glaciibacter sp. 2TAF33]|uniref:hypothetical protein n=1 Tax=Glaciibacter sp. 2TAF33 TaxID=3233015 RepID=UPI003F8EA98A